MAAKRRLSAIADVKAACGCAIKFSVDQAGLENNIEAEKADDASRNVTRELESQTERVAPLWRVGTYPDAD